jgi:hypothetical protein
VVLGKRNERINDFGNNEKKSAAVGSRRQVRSIGAWEKALALDEPRSRYRDEGFTASVSQGLYLAPQDPARRTSRVAPPGCNKLSTAGDSK